MKKIEKLNLNQLKVLELYIELELSKFSKKKKDIYEEIQKRTKLNKNTIISWIKRYLENYKEYREELAEERKNAIKGNCGGLTKKFEKYIYYRFSGMKQEEAKIKAGYSIKTKVANIERNPKVATSLAVLRETLMEDTRYGVMANLNALATIREQGIAGVELVEYTDSSTPDGHSITKTVRKEKQFIAAVAAAKEINNILGFKYIEELKAEKYKAEKAKQLVLIE